MEFQVMSDPAIEKEIGNRFKALRLRKNMTQAELARRACMHRNAVSALETGKGSHLSTMIALLRELGAIGNLNSFLPETMTISPIQIVEMQGKIRKRASKMQTSAPKKEVDW